MDLFGEILADPDSDPYDDEDSGRGGAVEIGSAQSTGGRSLTLSLPASMTFCLGYEEQERALLDAFSTGRLPHAIIFSGPQGIGKSTFAFRFARFLLKYGKSSEPEGNLFGGEEVGLSDSMDVPDTDPVFCRIASGGHGDLLYIERAKDLAKGREKAAMGVDIVRKITPFLRKTSAEGGWRVVIVDDADTMNTAAQNAILKILEEPPKKVMMILIAHHAGALIPTIRSRSRVMSFSALEDRVIQDLLARQGFVFSSTDAELICDFSGGSIGAALRFAEEGGAELFRELYGLLSTCPNWNWSDIHKFADSFAGAGGEKRYALAARILVWVFRRLVVLDARGGQAFPSYFLRGKAEGTGLYSVQGRFLDIADGLAAHFTRSEISNLDKRETVRSAFLVINP